MCGKTCHSPRYWPKRHFMVMNLMQVHIPLIRTRKLSLFSSNQVTASIRIQQPIQLQLADELAKARIRILIVQNTLKSQQYPSAAHFFFGPNIGSPTLFPVKRTFAAFCSLSSTSMAGKSAPVRSRSATYFTSTFALLARSFCVMVAPFWFLSLLRACERALETSSGTFFVATGPSARSTLVRRWPSGLPLVCGSSVSVYLMCCSCCAIVRLRS